jgi:transcriptional regulator
MYIPHFNAMDDDAEIRRLVADVGTAQLVTVAADGYPLATLLPVLWHGDRVIAHMARANEHWRAISAGAPGLLICTSAQAYISPSWYASKQEHGKVVPTWNYSAVHLSGRVTVHDDPEWVRDAVTELTNTHEQGREHPWAVSDAPEKYVAGQLRAIVGIEVAVQRVEGKAKLSQNRPEADQDGAIAGLRAEPGAQAHAVADDMVRVLHR